MNTPEPPKAPDPKETAAAQSGMNRDTAQTQQLTNMIDQITPEGSIKYGQTGTNSFIDSTGNRVEIPMFTATQEYSPENQKLFDLSKLTQLNIGQIGNDQSRRIGELLSSPIDLSNEAVEGRLFDLGRRRLDPVFAQRDNDLRTKLTNQGIREGSAAWDSAFTRENEASNDAYNQLALTGRAQSVQEILAGRNQPINEISALLSGSQVSQPNFVSAPQTQVAGVNYGQMVSDKYNADMQAYNSQVSSQNAMMGGLFGLASAPFQMFKFSDRRLKRDVRRVGSLESGLPVYTYRIGNGAIEMGVMADEAERFVPDAVATHESGLKMVDYGRVA